MEYIAAANFVTQIDSTTAAPSVVTAVSDLRVSAIAIALNPIEAFAAIASMGAHHTAQDEVIRAMVTNT